MPKTRQQRIAEELAGNAPSPPQVLTDKPHGPRRTRAKSPSAKSSAAEGPVVPSQPLAAPHSEAPRALVHVWVNENRYAFDPNHEYAISPALVPELVLFLNRLRDHGTQHSVTSFSSSATQVTPSLNRRQIAASFQSFRTEPQESEPSAPMEPEPASSEVVSPFKETSSQMENHRSFTRIKQPSQQFSTAMAPSSTPNTVRSPPQNTSRTELQESEPSTPMEPEPASSEVVSPNKEKSSRMEKQGSFTGIEQPSQQFSLAMAPPSTPAHVRTPPQQTSRTIIPQDSLPAGIGAPSKQAASPVKSARVHQPVNIMSQSVGPTHEPQQAKNPSGSKEIIHQQRLNQKMPVQKISVAKLDQTRPTNLSGSSLKRKLGACGDVSRKKRALSGKQLEPPVIMKKSSRVPWDPKSLRARGIELFFCNYRNLPAYTADGEVRYGVVKPSDDCMKFPDKVPANQDSIITNGRTTQTPQASSSSNHGRVTRPTRSVKRKFGFSPLTTISERSEATPPAEPTKSRPQMRVPSRLFDRMNANKRKRWTSPEPVPNPKGKSCGLGEVEFYGNAEEDEDQTAGQQPGKVRRTSNLHNFSSQGAMNSGQYRPCTGPKSMNSKPAIPVTNKAGSFKVPSPGDSDWSSSQSEDEGFSQAATAPSSTVGNRAPPAAAEIAQRIEVNPSVGGQAFEAALNSSPAPSIRPRFTAFEDWLQTASQSVASALAQMEVDPKAAGAGFEHGLVNDATT